jgi:hypothetical protein
MSKKMRLCLFATRKKIEALKKLPQIKELDVEVVGGSVGMRHEAAIMEMAEIGRAAGMDGCIMIFLDGEDE